MKIAHGTARLGSAFFFPLLLSLLIGTFPGLGFAHTSDWINTGQANARMVASSGSVMPGDSLWIAVEIDLQRAGIPIGETLVTRGPRQRSITVFRVG